MKILANSSASSSDESSSDLYWNAFRYIAEEMSKEEQFEFEEMMLENQAAREIVAQVVQLSQSVTILEDTSISQAQNSVKVNRSDRMVANGKESHLEKDTMHPAAWMSFGAALSLMIMMGFQAFTTASSSTSRSEIAGGQIAGGQIEGSNAAAKSTSSMALAYVESRNHPGADGMWSHPETDGTSVSAAVDGALTVDAMAALDVILSEEMEQSGVEVPQWMVTALSQKSTENEAITHEATPQSTDGNLEHVTPD